jgi:hypothetical protein
MQNTQTDVFGVYRLPPDGKVKTDQLPLKIFYSRPVADNWCRQKEQESKFPCTVRIVPRAIAGVYK